MPDSISTQLIAEFSDMVHTEAQQLQTRLRSKVITKMVSGNEFSYDSIGDSEAHEVLTRNAETKYNDITHSRRWGTMRRFTWSTLLDSFDDLQMLTDPQSEYAKAAARALYKKTDRIIVEALDATVKTGRTSATSTLTFANDGGTSIASGSAGLTFAKMRDVVKNWTDNDVGNDLPENFTLLITGQQQDDVLGEEKFTSGDYNSGRFVENGKVTGLMGHDVIHFAGGSTANPILTKSGNDRNCFCITDRSVCLGINKDLTITIDRIPTKNNAIQVHAEMFMGAVRTEGALVQKVLCTEA